MQSTAFISIKGIEQIDSNENVIEFKTNGTFEKKNDIFFINYDETDEEGHTTKTVIRATSDSIALKRDGIISQTMLFRKNERHLCQYNTLFGQMILGVNTTDLICKLTESGGNLSIKYGLEHNGSLLSNHILTVKVTKR
jgi:uncharacterized beta-barrel protein YwiB (DUF1934 family)